MQYKGFSITITDQIGGYGYLATDQAGTVIESPQNNRPAFASQDAATTAAKAAISQFLNSYHYEGEAKL